MPELPEVETTRRGLEPLLIGQTIDAVEVRQPRLRWPVDASLGDKLRNHSVLSVDRRAKYLLLETATGTLMIHLGMSGSLRYIDELAMPSPHDHVDILFSSGGRLRFNDPRRFGSLHFTRDTANHWLLRDLGPEPLGEDFTAAYLFAVSRNRRVAVKQHLMNSRIVVGVGNIYASEALFRAGIHPQRAAGRISRSRVAVLVESTKAVLRDAIDAGGTSLRDFVGGDGRPGYFQQELLVYGREDEPCVRCSAPVRHRLLGQRATYYCPRCQR